MFTKDTMVEKSDGMDAEALTEADKLAEQASEGFTLSNKVKVKDLVFRAYLSGFIAGLKTINRK